MKLLCASILTALYATAVFSADSQLPELAQIKMAAERGDAEAQYKLGERYKMRGDSHNAEIWQRKAASSGLAAAQYSLGCLLKNRIVYQENGQQVTRDANPTEAIQWFSRAAKQGHDGACDELGQFYQDGKTVKQDYAEAYKWFSLAVIRKNYLTAKMHRDSLILKMSSAQIADGQHRTDSYLLSQSSSSPVAPK